MSKDKDQSRFRLVVLVTKDDHPELFAELSQRSQSFRAERLRMLATFSLMGTQPLLLAGAAVGSIAPPAKPVSTVLADESSVPAEEQALTPEEVEAKKEQERLEKRRLGLKDSIKQGFDLE